MRCRLTFEYIHNDWLSGSKAGGFSVIAKKTSSSLGWRREPLLAPGKSVAQSKDQRAPPGPGRPPSRTLPAHTRPGGCVGQRQHGQQQGGEYALPTIAKDGSVAVERKRGEPNETNEQPEQRRGLSLWAFGQAPNDGLKQRRPGGGENQEIKDWQSGSLRNDQKTQPYEVDRDD